MPISDTALAGIVGSIVTGVIGLTGYLVNRKTAVTTAEDLMKKQQLTQLELLKNIRDDGLSEFRDELKTLKEELTTLRHDFSAQAKELLDTQKKLAVAEASFVRSENEKKILEANMAEMQKDMEEFRLRTLEAIQEKDDWKQAYHDMYEKYDRQTEQYQLTLQLSQNQSEEIRLLRGQIEDIRKEMASGGEMGR